MGELTIKVKDNDSIFNWFIFFVAILCSLFTVVSVHASTFPHSLGGDDLYQESEFLDQDQVNEIARINKQLKRQKQPQYLQVIILDHVPFDYQGPAWEDFRQGVGDQTVANDALDELYQHSSSFSMEPDAGVPYYKTRNLLVYFRSTGEVSFRPSNYMWPYFIDRIWKQTIFGLKHGLKKQNPATLVRLTQRISRKTLKYSTTAKKVPQKKRWPELLFWPGVIFGLYLFFKLVEFLIKHGKDGGGGPTPGPEDYYADGYFDRMLEEPPDDFDREL